MSESTPWSAQSGRQGGPPEHIARPGPDDGRPRGESGRPLRDATSLSVQGRHAEELLFRARAHADSLAAQAQAEAEELLSRAHAQAELLRVQVEAMRAEAECMRSEAGLAAAVRDEVEAARSCAEAAAVEARAAAEELHSSMQLDVAATRHELEQMSAAAMSIRRSLRTELDAGLADVGRLRGEVRRLCADANKLTAELRLLLAAAGGTDDRTGAELDAGPADEWPSTEPHGTHSVESDEGPSESASAQGATAGPRTGTAPPPSDTNVAELLRQIWDAASANQSTVSEAAAEPETPTGPLGGFRAAQPLIGSGGWRAKEGAAPDVSPEAGDATAPPAPPGRRRRRFHRD